MWGKRQRHERPGMRKERPDDDATGCEYLEPERAAADEDDDRADSLGWRAARHSRPQDWPARPERG